MTTITGPERRTVAVADIKPYWRNPRRIPAEAIAAVRESIERYGYQQPIVVDADLVVVVGHTRLQAIQDMGVTQVEVQVTHLPEDKVREYRLVDNRTGEMGQWDHDALVVELREFEASLLDQFFPDVSLEIEAVEAALVKQEDVEEATRKVTAVKEAAPVHTTNVVCPACLHTFAVSTASLPGLTRADLDLLNAG